MVMVLSASQMSSSVATPVSSAAEKGYDLEMTRGVERLGGAVELASRARRDDVGELVVGVRGRRGLGSTPVVGLSTTMAPVYPSSAFSAADWIWELMVSTTVDPDVWMPASE